MKRRALFLLIFGVFLAVILGYLFITDADHSQTNSLFIVPAGIWDSTGHPPAL